MNVKELIAELQKLPPDLKVYRYDDFCWASVCSVSVHKNQSNDEEWVQVL